MKKSQASISLSAPMLQLKQNQEEMVPVLIKIAHPKPKTKQKPLRKSLALVIDTSGSMAGSPLHDAVMASCALLDKLTQQDQVGVISYHSVVDVVSPMMFCTPENVSLIKSRLRALVATDSTALHAGWLHGAQLIAKTVKEFDINRVILLSDGNANVGLRDPEAFRNESIKLLACGIGTSTYGVGHHFDESIMTLVAQGGNAFFAQSSEELEEYFNNEFSLMDNVALKNVRVRFNASCPHELLNDLPQVDEEVLLPSVVYESQAWCVFECNHDGLKPLKIDAQVMWEENDETFTKRVTLELPIVAKLPKKNSSEEALFIKERCKELHAAKIQQQAALAARQGRWKDVDNLVASMDTMACGNAYVAGVSNTLRGLSQTQNASLFTKEATYASTTMNRRISAVNEDESSTAPDALGLRKVQQGTAKGEKK